MNFTKNTLKNGLRIITIPMSQLKSVAVMILVGAGSRYEEEERQGVAHFIEHMMFKGTKRRPTPLAVASEMDAMGAEFNAFTAHELTGFYAKSAAKNFARVLDVLVDILLNSRFAEAELKRERGVILEERRMYRDNPRDHIWDLYSELSFGGHPLGWPVIGQERTIRAIERQDFFDYCRRWYKPGNIAVAVAGDISADKAIAEVRRLLGGMVPAEWERAIPFTGTEQLQPRVLLERRKTDQTHLMLGVRGYPLDHPRKHAYTVLNTVLGTGMSSRLFTKVREELGLAYYINSSVLSHTDAGTIFARGGVSNHRVNKALAAIIGEFRRLKEELVDPEELVKAKEMIRGRLALGLESSDDVAEFVVSQEMLKGKIETPEELMKKVDAVTAEEIREVARELFTSETLNLAVVGPYARDDEATFLSLLDLS